MSQTHETGEVYIFPHNPTFSQDKMPEHPLQTYTNITVCLMLTLGVIGLILVNILISFLIYRLSLM